MLPTTTLVSSPDRRVGLGRLRTVRLRWRARGVRTLTGGELESFVAILENHALTSRIEVRERQHAVACGRGWRPVAIEVNGGQAVDPEQLGRGCGDETTTLQLRTFGYTATVTVAAAGIELVVDDEEDDAIRLLGALRAVVPDRRNPALAFLESEWGMPALILGLPVVASFAEVAAGRDGLTLESVGLAAVALVFWLWWSHARRPRRPSIDGTAAGAVRQGTPAATGLWVGADGEALAGTAGARRR